MISPSVTPVASTTGELVAPGDGDGAGELSEPPGLRSTRSTRACIDTDFALR